MRSRPKLQVLLRPGVAVAGEDLVVELALDSRSDTPVDGVVLTLRGTEAIGLADESTYVSHVHAAQRATFPATRLGKGVHRRSAKFVLPPDAPPSWRGGRSRVEYELDVHVVIPWWPDRRERYVVPVTRRGRDLGDARPEVFSSSASPQGDRIYAELALDARWAEPGGTISGAVSFSNVARRKPKRIELSFVASEGTRVGPPSDFAWADGPALVSRILDRAPREGETVPFKLRLPRDVTPGFASRLVAVKWRLAVHALSTFGSDVVLQVPIDIVAPSRRTTRGRRLAVAPPVGRERRALVWKAAAQRLELESDADAEEMRGAAGAASFALRLEQRDGVGLFAICELDWSSIGADLEVRERKWTDAFGAEIELDDRDFRGRFRVDAKDESLARALLDEDVRRALLRFNDVRVDDEGALLARPISPQSLESLLEGLEPAIAAARTLGDAVARLPVARDGGPYR